MRGSQSSGISPTARVVDDRHVQPRGLFRGSPAFDRKRGIGPRHIGMLSQHRTMRPTPSSVDMRAMLFIAAFTGVKQQPHVGRHLLRPEMLFDNHHAMRSPS